ncbi:ATP-binding protein [Acidimangrovimonas pyrenivorans]|uniref:histidine kinase n=1 Tax=Acidimangrovimonas pyrenivorans TaxID=2030798 RepID=A0ABV7AGF7_9RHOB
MKRLLPRTLRGQLIVLIIAALAVAQAITLWLFIDQRALAVRSALSLEAADRAGNLVRLLEDAPPALVPEILRAANSPLVQFSIANAPAVNHLNHAGPMHIVSRIRALLGADDKRAIRVELHQSAGPMPVMPGASPQMMRMHQEMNAGQMSAVELSLSIQLKDGRWLNMTSRFHDPPYQWVWSETATFALTAALLGLVLWLALGRLVRPLKRLAATADRIGRGEEAGPIGIGGPEEMQQLAAAFAEMQDRLARFVGERTRLLGALGHDLRSPLTALRVRAEMVDDDETRERIIASVAEMQEMVEATLAFARGMATAERVETVELSLFLGAIVDEFRDAGGEVALQGADTRLRLRPNAMRRALRNLIENALRYGKRARITTSVGKADVRITIDDDGPGIPEDSLERVFDPFVRLEGSRSRETGGTGLGLSIARTIVHAHGGEVTLGNRPEGGLRAEIRLPLGSGEGPRADATVGV